jgi:transcription elongation factor/antiterminator RfaH
MDGNFPRVAHHRAAPLATQDCEDWYLARLKPGGLRRAKENLSRQGVTFFCPMRTRTRRERGRLVTGPKPLFPGYLFIQVRPETVSWRSINATYGVSQVVCLEPGRPSRVPGGIMSALLDSEFGESTADRETLFEPGEDVRVVVGPFADLLAKVEAAPEKDRIFVLLDMMGRTVRAQLSGADLERL